MQWTVTSTDLNVSDGSRSMRSNAILLMQPQVMSRSKAFHEDIFVIHLTIRLTLSSIYFDSIGLLFLIIQLTAN